MRPDQRGALSFQQLALLRFLTVQQIAGGGVSPTFDECARHLGVASKSTVSRLMDALEARGYIRRLFCRWRSIEVLRPAPVSCAPDGGALFFVPVFAGSHRGTGPAASCAAGPDSIALFHGAGNTQGGRSDHV